MNSQTVYLQIREISSGARLGHRAALTPFTLELKKNQAGRNWDARTRGEAFPLLRSNSYTASLPGYLPGGPQARALLILPGSSKSAVFP